VTCVAGIAEEGRVWIGADSAASDNVGCLALRAAPKVFRLGNMVIGCSGSFRASQLIRYKLSVPEHKRGALDKWMATTFVEGLRKALMDGGHTVKKDNEEMAELWMLVGVRGRLFQVEGDFQVGENVHGFDAVGSGAEAALGALFARRTGGPRARIMSALKAASAFRVDVRPPFRLESV
jgi:hypothetical protein